MAESAKKQTSDDEQFVLSEDVNAGLATPLMDLIAAAAVGAIAIWFTIASLLLPIPGGVLTAPGLLPFLTSASLLIMAALLAVAALRRWRIAPGAEPIELPAEFAKSMLLGALLVVYVAAMQYLPVGTAIRLGSLRLVIGKFEVASLIVLTTILRIYWRAPLWKCTAVTFGWIAFLSVAFRLVFEIQLP
jgi:hypothetical protein